MWNAQPIRFLMELTTMITGVRSTRMHVLLSVDVLTYHASWIVCFVL